MTLTELIPVLQVAVGPVILISGVGLLLLNMTNRLARTIDRSRQLVTLLRSCEETERQSNKAQLDILWRRACLLRTAIALATTSALLAALLVIVLFLGVLLNWEMGWLVSLLFVGCLLAIIGALIFFLRDINVTLHALALELGREEKLQE
ncbi:MAG: DUF2721 domain-containing protein [Bythopirellula sp.]|nr:DUF2721 domain-containing protein [Bythopirellula sp.]